MRAYYTPHATESPYIAFLGLTIHKKQIKIYYTWTFCTALIQESDKWVGKINQPGKKSENLAAQKLPCVNNLAGYLLT